MTFPKPVRRYTIYRNPENSEVSSEHDSLIEAMLADPTENAEIILNGVVLAQGLNDGWTATTDGLAEFQRVYAKTA